MDAESALLAASVISLAGGVENIAAVERCMVRLRLVLADPEASDVEAIGALPGVALAMHLTGQLQIAPLSHLDDLYATVTRIVATSRA
ncbi:PTS transporter subunit EIIB [Demequina salsinemoris]|uniref:PTS transporter subunit EIIB n=1 Tax=Demequina salsinemoris TaxID=577470 RepID=UPI00078610FE|nr:PTS transporter subunit EIIB [Demequina salsinemoris]